MSEQVKVITVPDEALGCEAAPEADDNGQDAFVMTATGDEWSEGLCAWAGDIVLVDPRYPVSDTNALRIPRDWIPALLRALVEQAGGVEVEVNDNCEVWVKSELPANISVKSGDYIILPLEALR